MPQRSRVIVHMTTSVDGRVKTRRWSQVDTAGVVEKAYELVHDKLAVNAWMARAVDKVRFDKADGSR